MPQAPRRVVCTIVDSRHLELAYTLWQSMTWQQPVKFVTLVCERSPVDLSSYRRRLTRLGCSMELLPVTELPATDRLQVFMTRFPTLDMVRWALKPVLLEYLLQDHEQAIFLDSDIYFTGNYGFLWDEMDCGILLTPHYRPIVPLLAEDATHWRNKAFLFNMTDGIFNAGFVGVTRRGLPVLDWWRQPCEWLISNDKAYGLFWDQKYLDLVPVYFQEHYKTLTHRGCNVAAWNDRQYTWSTKDAKIYLEHEDQRYPLVFIHGYNHSMQSNHYVVRAIAAAYIEQLAANFELIYPHGRPEAVDGRDRMPVELPPAQEHHPGDRRDQGPVRKDQDLPLGQRSGREGLRLSH
jgi:hypothetical protein